MWAIRVPFAVCFFGNGDQMTSKDNFTKEIEVDLQKYWQVLKRRWLLIALVSGATTALAGLISTHRPDEYVAEARLLFESSNLTSSLVGLESNDTELRVLNKQADPLDTQVEIIRSVPIAQAVIDQLALKDVDGEPIETTGFLEKLDVYPVPGTDVLAVAYTSSDPELSTAVVNLMTELFIQQDVESSRSAASKAQQFISTQLPQSESAVRAAESDLRQFKEANNVIDLASESKSTVDSLSNFQSWATELTSSLAGVEAKIVELQSQLGFTPQQAYAIGLVSENAGVQELLTEAQVAQSELATAQTRYEDTHPEIGVITARLQSLYALLDQRINQTLGDNIAFLPGSNLQAGDLEKDMIATYLDLSVERTDLQQRLQKVFDARAIQQSRAQVLPGLEEQQRDLERKLTAAQTTYETLLESFQQAQILENKSTGNARVVSPALVPLESVSPSLKLYLLAGGILGALLGVTLAFLVDMGDRSARTVKDGQNAYGLPLLGVIPAWTKLRPSASPATLESPQILVQAPQPVPIIEAYQALQANLKFSSPDKPLKVIGVTSAVAGEGKSEVAANLALTLAHLGHRVLVVDADMRSPTQHHIWDVSERQGLTNFAVGQLPLKNAIVLRGPNLHVLPVGAIPPNPLAILESKQVAALLKACEKAYDYIIIDTPSLLGLADTPTIGRLTDGLLVVMQPGRVDVDSIRAARLTLAQSKQNVLGLVANGVTVQNKTDRYFYHRQEHLDTPEMSEIPATIPAQSEALTQVGASSQRQ